MNGKSYSLPIGMVFRKYHCAKCGAVLKRERTHRIVTPNDIDYYQYQDYGTFPRRNYDVYNYRFACPSCNARVSYDEQCIIRRIQKKQGSFVLASSEMKANYQESKKSNINSILMRNIVLPVIFMLIAFALFYFFGKDKTTYGFMRVAVFLVITVVVSVVSAIRRFKGNYKSKRKRTYSYEEETQMNRLHAYSSHNQKLVLTSDKCYCFYCKRSMYHGEIKDYVDNGQTALCPKCGIDSIIPDSIGETVDDDVIARMHEYWF